MKKERDKRWDNLRPMPLSGEIPLAEKPLSARVEPEIDQAVRSLANPSAWMRRVITEAARRELLGKEERS
jgi:hypothetical protein